MKKILDHEYEPCPFCAEVGDIVFIKASGEEKAGWYDCRHCGASGPMAPTREEALARWNARPLQFLAMKMLALGRRWLQKTDNAFDELYDFIESYWKEHS